MVWYFIGVYIINRTLHGRLEIRNFSSSVEKYFTSERSERVKYFFQHEKRNFVSPRGHVISSISAIMWKDDMQRCKEQLHPVSNFWKIFLAQKQISQQARRLF